MKRFAASAPILLQSRRGSAASVKVTAPAPDNQTMKWILTVAAVFALIYWLRTRRDRK
jgi:hypothetical protein